MPTLEEFIKAVTSTAVTQPSTAPATPAPLSVPAAVPAWRHQLVSVLVILCAFVLAGGLTVTIMKVAMGFLPRSTG